MATVPQSNPDQPRDHAESKAELVHVTAEPQAERRVRYGQPFFPAVPAGLSLYLAATVAALFILAVTTPAPLQNPADSLNHEGINPRPEWYFLFLFQILKYFQGPWEIVGTAVIPGVIGIILIGLPFYDRNWSKRAARRPVAIGSASVIILALAILTYLPLAPTGSSGTYSDKVLATPSWSNISAIFSKNCGPCHIGSATAGLNLDSYASAMKGGAISAGGVINGAVIKAGNPTGSYLWQVVAGRKDLYKLGADMPFGKPKIPSVDQQNIFNWIKNGAKNN